MAVGNTKLYHDQVRNLFSSATAAATNSPLAFLERTSTATEKLLREQMSANDNVAKILNKHGKMLEKLLKTSKDGLGISDLIMAKYLGRILGGAAGAVGGLIGGGLRLGGKLAGGALRALTRGMGAVFTKLNGWMFKTAGQYLETGMRMISNVGKPLLNLTSKLQAIISSGGLLRQAAQLGARLSKYAPLLFRGLGKLAWPITALMGIIDGVTGFMNADKELGNGGKVNILRKIEFAKASIINGLLLGLPDYISNKFTGMGFGKFMDTQMVNIGNSLRTLGSNFAEQFKGIVGRTQQLASDMWKALPTREDMSTAVADLRDQIMGLGGYIKSGVAGMIDDIKGWFKDIFSWRPWSSDAGVNTAPQAYQKNLLPGGRGVNRQNNAFSNFLKGMDKFEPKKPSNDTSLPKRPISFRNPARGATAPIRAVLASHTPTSQLPTSNEIISSVRAPQEVKDMISVGTAAMTAIGTGLVKTQVDNAAEIAKATGEEAGKSLSDGITSVLSDAFSATNLAKIFGNVTGDMQAMFGRMFSGDSMSAIAGIVSGTAGSADYGASYGSPADSAVDAPPAGGYTPSTGATTGEISDSNARPVYAQLMDTMMEAGASKLLASAITGSMDVESRNPRTGQRFDPNVSGDKGKAYGLNQWWPDRQAKLQAFAKEHGLNPADRSTQAKFAVEETKTGSKYADYGAAEAARVIAANPNMSPTEASNLFTKKGQRPGVPHYGRRAASAEQFFREYDTATPSSAYTNTPNAAYDTSIVKQNQGQQAAIRKREITDTLNARLSDTILRTLGPGYTASVYSGGQAAKGTRGRRTGSTRHDLGHAGDLRIYGPDGKMITQEQYALVGQAWLANKYGGVGMQMKGGGIHLDEHQGRAPWWRYDQGEGGPRLSKQTLETIKKGLSGEHPEYKMTPEQATAYLNRGRTNVTEERAPLSESPMFAGRAPRSTPQTTTSSNRFGVKRDDATELVQSAAAMRSRLQQPGVRDYSELLGSSGVAAMPNKQPTIAKQSPEITKPRIASVMTSTRPDQPTKQTMKPADPNLSTAQTPMPSIESIPSIDELKMLSVNSEMLN